MSTPPTQAINKFVMHKRVADVEKLAANCDTAVRELTARFDRQPPRGDIGSTGPKGDSIKGDAGTPGRDGAASNIPGPAGRDGASIVGPAGRDGRDAPQRTELDNLLRDNKALHSAFAALTADFDLLSRAFTSHSQKTSDYLAFLQARAAARIASGNVQK